MRSENFKGTTVQKTVELTMDDQGSPLYEVPPILRQASSEAFRKERTKRPKTTYSLAHPPPGGKIPLRPKVLLQLQKVAPNTRSVPAFEVLSVAAFTFKTGRAIKSLWSGKSRIRPEDLVVLQGQDYSNNGSAPTEPKRGSSRHVVGVICRRKGAGKGATSRTEICLEDGSVWDATAMSNGGYEFNSQQEHGLTSSARWVRRHPAKPIEKSPTPNIGVPEQKVEDRSFMFTKITPNMRQHPIVGCMNRTKLEVYDQYSVPSASNTDRIPGTTRPKRLARQKSSSSFSILEGGEGVVPVTTESSLRDLILVSGILVAFREGWSSMVKFEEERDHCSRPSSPPHTRTHRRCPSDQTLSTSSESGAPQAPPNDTGVKNGVKRRLMRTGSKIWNRSSSSGVPGPNTPTKDTTPLPPPPSSTSTGVAFIRKVNRSDPNGITPASNPHISNSFHSSQIGLGIEGNEAIASPAFYAILPQSASENPRSISSEYETRLEAPNEDIEDAANDNSNLNEDATCGPQTGQEVENDDGLVSSTETSTARKEPESETSYLYKPLKDILNAFKKSSGLA
ncbi:hypothetical protein EV356DRAFT_535647 [Viridothelium virens]|uniref:Uncharacterized protein n=1 Tax=Viridothelium virens TaxID=1048519 RepID=A0A6A6H044_VIRVR|nr:hypothetical protein EV356DRAFT_535647 [Viridothelium virens]